MIRISFSKRDIPEKGRVVCPHRCVLDHHWSISAVSAIRRSCSSLEEIPFGGGRLLRPRLILAFMLWLLNVQIVNCGDRLEKEERFPVSVSDAAQKLSYFHSIVRVTTLVIDASKSPIKGIWLLQCMGTPVSDYIRQSQFLSNQLTFDLSLNCSSLCIMVSKQSGSSSWGLQVKRSKFDIVMFPHLFCEHQARWHHMMSIWRQGYLSLVGNATLRNCKVYHGTCALILDTCPLTVCLIQCNIFPCKAQHHLSFRADITAINYQWSRVSDAVIRCFTLLLLLTSDSHRHVV